MTWADKECQTKSNPAGCIERVGKKTHTQSRVESRPHHRPWSWSASSFIMRPFNLLDVVVWMNDVGSTDRLSNMLIYPTSSRSSLILEFRGPARVRTIIDPVDIDRKQPARSLRYPHSVPIVRWWGYIPFRFAHRTIFTVRLLSHQDRFIVSR